MYLEVSTGITIVLGKMRDEAVNEQRNVSGIGLGPRKLLVKISVAFRISFSIQLHVYLYTNELFHIQIGGLDVKILSFLHP